MSADPVERVRAICMALPAAVEKPFGGHDAPAFRVNDKIFANLQTGRGCLELVVKGGPGAQDVLVHGDPSRYFLPPYSAHQGWIGIHLDEVEPDWPLIEELITESYRLIAPKRLVAQMDAGQA